MKYGQLIKNMRLGRGFTLNHVASKIGIGRSTIALVERGEIAPFVRIFNERLLDCLGATPDEQAEVGRAWRAEQVPAMTPRYTARQRPAGFLAKAGLTSAVNELEKAVAKVEKSESPSAPAAGNEFVFGGTVAEVREHASRALRRAAATRRARVTITLY